MKIKLLENCNSIMKGTILPVRKLNQIADTVAYQVIDDPHIGMVLENNERYFLEIKEDEKLFSENEWNDMKNRYIKELENELGKNERALKLVKSLENQLCKKNSEIEKLEYFVTSLTLSLKLSSDYVLELRKQLQK